MQSEEKSTIKHLTIFAIYIVSKINSFSGLHRYYSSFLFFHIQAFEVDIPYGVFPQVKNLKMNNVVAKTIGISMHYYIV
jgi:hypothetical protein